ASASLRGPQPLLSTSEPPGFAGRFRTPFNSVPVDNGGLPAAASRCLSPRRLAGAIRSRSPSRFSPSPVRFPVRATYSFPLERRSPHRSETLDFWPSLRPGSVAQGRSVQLISEELTSAWSAPRSYGGAGHAAHAPPAQGARDPSRPADGDRLHGHGEAPAVPHRAAPAGIHLLGPPGDRPSGPRALPTVPGGGRPRFLGLAARALPHASRRHPLPLSPRVLPLVALPHARLGRCRGD